MSSKDTPNYADGKLLVSTYVVCERLSVMHYHIPVGTFQLAEFVFKIPLVPPLKYFGNAGLEEPPSPRNENLCRSRHFEFELVWSSPPPMKNCAVLGTLNLSWSGVLPPVKICVDLGTLSLSWSGVCPPELQGARMWRLIAVSPVDTISLTNLLIR